MYKPQWNFNLYSFLKSTDLEKRRGQSQSELISSKPPKIQHLQASGSLKTRQNTGSFLQVEIKKKRQRDLELWSPAFLASGTDFVEDNFSMDWNGWGGGNDFRRIQVHYIYCALYFYYYYISSTSDHQTLDPGGW